MPRYKLVLEYDGGAFHGWQSQKHEKNVQDTLRDALQILLSEEIQVSGASRTDSGVHARCQVASFVSGEERDTRRMLAGLNGILPRSLRVRAAEQVPDVFDPRRDCMGKTYRYTWFDGPVHPPFWQAYSAFAKGRLDDAAMAAAAAHLVGEHDFSSFRAAGCTGKTPVRRITKCEIRRKGERVTMEIHGTAFLQKMVRNIAGTLQDVGLGKRTADSVVELLGAKDRTLAGNTAPAAGLVLWQVDYGQIPRPGRKVGPPPPVQDEFEDD
jgi:tRNA pseudouridine38-40 synthase